MIITEIRYFHSKTNNLIVGISYRTISKILKLSMKRKNEVYVKRSQKFSNVYIFNKISSEYTS